MYKELTVRIGKKDHKIFLQNGLGKEDRFNPYHKHNYTEVHLIAGGDAKFAVSGRVYDVPAGSLFVIPGWHMHGCIERAENILSSSFQINMLLRNPIMFDISEDIIKDFIDGTKVCEVSGDYTKLASYLALFASYIPGHETPEVKDITDYSFLLREFLAKNYANPDLRLKDLADELHISERQAERIVRKHTANTFKNELMLTRSDVASYLMKYGNLSLTEIASKVGYHSYAGFWKAMKRRKLL